MGTSNSKSSLSSDPAIDPLPYLTADLPQHIVETKLPPGSGRLFRSYRIRSHEGVTLVCKAAVIKYTPPTLVSRVRSRTNLISTSNATANNTEVSTVSNDEDNYSISTTTTSNQGSSQQSSHVTKHPLIEHYEAELRRVCSLVGDPNSHPNVLPYQSVLVGPSAPAKDRSGSVVQSVYLLRQHGLMTLSDRLATRPFLTSSEKTWIAYQILRALQSIHDSGVCHGYVSSDNILVTSWGWVLLTDFATFKPTRIPDNDPSEFTYYFQRQVENDDHREKPCYLAPERLYSKNEQKKYENNSEAPVSSSMDVFSAGCVLIELFLNGEKAFDLGDLLEYKKDGSVPSLVRKLNKIESCSMRSACKHMISLDPKSRLSASSYISLLSRPSSPTSKTLTQSFPSSFESFLFPLMKRLRCEIMSPDARIAMVASRFGDAMVALCNDKATHLCSYFFDVCGPHSFPRAHKLIMRNIVPTALKSHGGPEPNIKSQLGRWKNLLNETESLLSSLKDGYNFDEHVPINIKKDFLPDFALTLNQISGERDGRPVNQPRSIENESHLIVLVQLVLSAMRHTQHPSSRLVALKLLADFSYVVTDEVRLQRMVPIIVRFLDDSEVIVRCIAIKVLASVLENIRIFPPSDALIFPQFIFPRLDIVVNDPDVAVRVSFAESIAKISHAAQRFLDINEAMKLHESLGNVTTNEEEKDGKHRNVPSDFPDHVAKLLDEEPTTPTSSISGSEHFPNESDLVRDFSAMTLVENTYEAELKNLRDTVSRWVFQITTNNTRYSNLPKTALLLNLAKLCSFFGKEETLGTMLPQVLTFLNDKRDWELRISLWKQLPNVCGIAGKLATEQFVVPCIETSLVDSEEKVISQVLFCLGSLWKMKLLSRGFILGARAKKILNLDSLDREKGETSARSPNEGILTKCVPLLVHPSACVRKSTVDLISAICVGLQFPDDTVFVLPLLRPFIRYSLSSEQLCSSTQLSKSLIYPIEEKRLLTELRVRHKALGRKSSIDSESISSNLMIDKNEKDSSFDDVMSTTNSYVNASSRQNLPDKMFEHGFERVSGDDVNPSEVIPQHSPIESSLEKKHTSISKICKYLELIECFGLQNFQHNRPKRQIGLAHGRMYVEIDHATASKAYSFIVPNQKFIELFASPLPNWFSDLREASSGSNQLCSPLSACRSPSTIADLFGLSLMQPTHSLQHMRKWQGENIFIDDIQPGLESISSEKATKILSSKESQILEAAKHGQWNSIAVLDPSLLETCLLLSKLDCLEIPPLSPRLGLLRETDGRAYSWHGPSTIVPTETSQDNNKKSWLPSPDCMLASSSSSVEHTAAISRLVVSQDQSFFVSSSHDGTCRVWELRQIENTVDLQSSLTYAGHSSDDINVRVNDLCVIENSHSVVSAASNGSIHAWRVEMVTSSKSKVQDRSENNNWYYETSRVCGSSIVRKLDQNEGEVLAVSHWNTNTSSIIAFASQQGGIHTWDLRCAKEPFNLKLRPELGYLTSMAVGTDRNWLVAGTNQGYIALWDIRYQMLVKLWRHSSRDSISRLATSHTILPQDKIDEFNIESRKPYIFVGCGRNEASIFDVTNAACRQCFRVLDHTYYYTNQQSIPSDMPELHPVECQSNPNRIISAAARDRVKDISNRKGKEPNILSLMGRIGSTGRSYLITGGSDRCLRFWDFLSPSRCFTISGPLDQSQQFYENIDVPAIDGSPSSQKLFICRTVAPPPTSDIPSVDVPNHFKQGLVRPMNAHRDAILDVKSVEYPKRCLLSGSRDGVVKLWR